MRIIHVLRKPCSESTVAANTLKHGTGGINIDASRVGVEERTYKGSGVSQMRYTDGRAGLTDGRGRDMEFSVSGRWPANVILQHLDGCRCDGVKKVRGTGDKKGNPNVGATDGVYGKYTARSQVHHTAPDGTETIANWICEPGCPVARLDEQSGVLTSGVMKGQQRGWGFHGIYGASGDTEATSYGDTGGASRFYKQVGGSDE